MVFTAADAVKAGDEGRDVILVRPFTEADDVAGFHAAKGILTSEGGKASHAALVARGMGRPAVVGASALAIDLKQKVITVNGTKISEGDRIAIDGTKGCVTLEDVPLVEAEVNEHFERVLEWADEVRRLGVRANADTPEDAKKARELGAEGIGLCRTEHMFMAEDRQPKMRAMIMADDEEGRREALAELLPFQQEDFEGLFEAMKGLPVTIRLLDPPLHEFLKNLPDLRAQVERARIEVHRRPRAAREDADPRRGDPRGEPDARHPRLPARDPLSRDLRDAGRGDHAGRRGHGRQAAPRDHDPARSTTSRSWRSSARWWSGSATSMGCTSGRTTPSGP